LTICSNASIIAKQRGQIFAFGLKKSDDSLYVIRASIGVLSKTDRLFLGGGAYMWDADPALKEYISDTLDPQYIGELVAFSTAGRQKAALKRIMELATEKGINVNDNGLLVKMALKGHTALERTGGELTEKHISTIKGFLDLDSGVQRVFHCAQERPVGNQRFIHLFKA
jgi:hypothetical protein